MDTELPLLSQPHQAVSCLCASPSSLCWLPLFSWKSFPESQPGLRFLLLLSRWILCIYHHSICYNIKMCLISVCVSSTRLKTLWGNRCTIAQLGLLLRDQVGCRFSERPSLITFTCFTCLIFFLLLPSLPLFDIPCLFRFCLQFFSPLEYELLESWGLFCFVHHCLEKSLVYSKPLINTQFSKQN